MAKKLIQLHEFSQDTFVHGLGSSSKGGVCYYMCNYVEENIWSNVKTYDEAKTKAINFTDYKKMMNVAIVTNHIYGQNTNYNRNVTNFSPNSLYRVEVGINSDVVNHEIIMITGNREFVFFDPNYGFLLCDGYTVQDFRDCMDTLYRNGNIMPCGFFNVRKISNNTPLGFSK